MYVVSKTDNHCKSTNCTQIINNENDDINIIPIFLFLSFPSGVLLLSPIKLLIWTTLISLLTNKNWTVFYTQLTLLDVLIQDHLNVKNNQFFSQI